MSQSFEDYNAQVEQQEFMKQQAAEAWADSIVKMMGDHMDEDKRLMFREGLKAILSGPPRMPQPEYMPPSPRVLPPSVFTYTSDAGTTIYDWPYIAQRSSHSTRLPNGNVIVWDGDKRWMTLQGPPAESFWLWVMAVSQPLPTVPQVDAEFSA